MKQIKILALGAILGILAILWVSIASHNELAAVDNPATSRQVFYAPEDRPADHLVSLYTGAKTSIFLAMYGLTYPPIVKALVAAHKRGVDVRLITDRAKMQGDQHQRTAVETLRLAGIPVKVNRHDGLMHMKQVVIDDTINTSGSFNQTSSAAYHNDERLDILHDLASTRRTKEKFLEMWADRSRYEDWPQ